MNTAIYDRLVDLARNAKLAAYSDIAPLAGLSMDDEDDRKKMSDLLEEIVRHEHAAKRPMLTALVVHHGDDNNPGEGFFAIATTLGLFSGSRAPLKRLEFWVGQVTQVYNHWKNK